MSSFPFYDHLSARAYYSEPNKSTVYPNIETLFKVTDSPKHVDPAAVLGVLMKNYPMACRTLVDGACRTPWMAKPDTTTSSWTCASLPEHQDKKMAAKEIADVLKRKLEEELRTFVQGKSTVGILLSGGMDSRIVAGILRQLQEQRDFNGSVVGLTWGIDDCRDVIYAREISERFGWDFVHFPLGPDLLKNNIHLTAQRGAEYSPVHLHAMPDVSLMKGVDGILAGSYGDSIGRGEYSGRKVNRLPSILEHNLNHFGFLRKGYEKNALLNIKEDLSLSRSSFPNRSELSYREVEMQMHYMRRQLNACMEVIDDNIPLYQAFSSPDVFGFIWSLSPECRTDETYQSLLQSLPGNLLDIPWARTGKIYHKADGLVLDDYSKNHHSYGSWLRQDLRDYVIGEIKSGSLQSLNIFNESALDFWCRNWPSDKYSRADRLDEKMAWLCSLSQFVRLYDIQPPKIEFEPSRYERLTFIKSYIHSMLYLKAVRK